MMREQRGRHFDPMLLDAFMEVLGRSGPDARDAGALGPGRARGEHAGDLRHGAQRGDAEMAEGAIATAIEDGISPTTLHAEVIAPALRRIGELSEAGEIDDEREHRAAAITRRVLATLYRYMTRRHRADTRAGLARGRRGGRAHARTADGSRPARRGRIQDDHRHRPVRGAAAGAMVESQSPDARRRGGDRATLPPRRSTARCEELRCQPPRHPDRARRRRGRRRPPA